MALVVLLMSSIGLHWAFLQSVAWAGMIVSYTQETSSFTTALERTLDGKHPCKICVVVDHGKKADKESDKLPSMQKLELFSEPASPFVPTLRLASDPRPLVRLSEPARSSPPPLPPPRFA